MSCAITASVIILIILHSGIAWYLYADYYDNGYDRLINKHTRWSRRKRMLFVVQTCLPPWFVLKYLVIITYYVPVLVVTFVINQFKGLKNWIYAGEAPKAKQKGRL